MKPDLTDVLGVGGLGLMSTGLWLIYPPLALIIAGAVLTGLAVYRMRG